MTRKYIGWFFPFLTFVIILCLSACGGDVNVEVDFYRGENWQSSMTVTMPAEALALADSLADVEGQLDDLIAGAKAEGARASWKKASSGEDVIYTIEMKGKGLDTLSKVIFDGKAEIYIDESAGRREVHFSHYVSSGLGFSSQVITLRGGEILSGNGRYIEDRTMTWRNPSGRIEATLTEQPRFSLGIALGVVAILIVLVGLVMGGRASSQRKNELPPAPCPWCGFWLPEGARFCPGCGKAR